MTTFGKGLLWMVAAVAMAGWLWLMWEAWGWFVRTVQ